MVVEGEKIAELIGWFLGLLALLLLAPRSDTLPLFFAWRDELEGGELVLLLTRELLYVLAQN